MNPAAILVWNARGLNQKARRNSVRDVIFSSNADIVCLQETKVANISQHLFLSVFGTAYDNFISLPAIGTRGGVLIAWRAILVKQLPRGWIPIQLRFYFLSKRVATGGLLESTGHKVMIKR